MTSQNRPFKFGSKDRREFIVQESEVAIRATYDANNNLIILGRAKVGTAASEAKWQLISHAYDANNNMTSQTWPQNYEGNATNEYGFSWDLKATYTYS